MKTMMTCVLLALVSIPVLSYADTLTGFFKSSQRAYHAHEAAFLAIPAPEQADRWLFELTEEPHVAGTPAEKKVADYVAAKFAEFGLHTEVVQYDVFLNHPRKVSVGFGIEDATTGLPVYESPIPGDKDSTPHGMFPAFHGYGASGHVEAQVVYVNYGTPADYDKLASIGVSVEGKIALARYGQVFRGLKVKEAQEHGAVGCIIYSDPADDGYVQGDVYPDGPMRPASAIQRGSVQYLSIQPGDPSTPGWPSTKGAARVDRTDMKTVPGIPSIPLSYEAAEKILRRLSGPEVPEGWQGGLPFAYHIGPGEAVASLRIEMDEGLMPIYNVFARIEGVQHPEQWVILGNHRDAWNHGAVDPNSGTASQLETARGLAEALDAGWRPKRTILLASWDAEEYGLVGSTEWGEALKEQLSTNAVAYINMDSSATGRDFSVGGTPSLRDVVWEVANAVAEPRKGGTVGAAWEKRMRAAWASSAEIDLEKPDEQFELRLFPLGSGSDYTVFIDHLGIPSIDMRFRGRYGVYHSAFDTYEWVAKYGDPGFHYHAAAAKIFGLLAMRLSTADVIPMTFSEYGETLHEQLDDLRRRTIRKVRSAGDDAGEDGPINPNFASIIDAIDRFDSAGAKADVRLRGVVSGGDTRTAERVNEFIIQVERQFLDDEGLPPSRPWFKHMLYAPGTTTGYASWPFPGPAQAIEDKDSELFKHEAAKVVNALDRATKKLEEIAALR